MVAMVKWALAAACVTISAPAVAEVDALVRRAMELQAAGQAREAVALLLPFEAERAGDADFDYVLGLAAADAGMPGVALPALQRVLAVQPGNVQARAEIARVYAMAGDIDTAQAEFNTVIADPTLPDPVRQRFNGLVRDYGRQIAGGGTNLSGFVDLEGGYDDNINQATAAGTITLPVFAFLGPATLGATARRNGSAFGQAQGGLSVQAALSRETRIFASALGFYRDNEKNDTFDQAATTGTAGVGHTLANRDVVSLSGQVQQFWLGGSGYRASYGVIGQYTHRLARGEGLSATLNYARLDYRGAALRDADRFAASIGFAGRTSYATLTGGLEQTVRAPFRHYGHAFVGVQAGIEQPLQLRIAVMLGVAAEHRDHHGTDPLFLGGRRDTQIDASVGLRAMLAKGISVRPRATFTQNFSNFDLYDYRRVTASIGLRAEF